jgi:hypothetical protein
MRARPTGKWGAVKKKLVTFILFSLLSPLLAHGFGSREISSDSLIGEWVVRTSVPYTSPHHSFVFFEDATFAIYDEHGTMLEKNEISQRTDYSFVGNIIYTSPQHPLPEILGTSTYAVYEHEEKNKEGLVLRFYDDAGLNTLYVTFHLDRVSGAAEADPRPPAAGRVVSTAAAGDSREKDFQTVVHVDFDTTMHDWEYTRGGGSLEVVRDPRINDSRMGLITIPESPYAAGSRAQQAYATFRIDYQARLGETAVSFRACIPAPESGSHAPYVVFGIDPDNDGEAEGWVVGGRMVGGDKGLYPRDTWFEYRLDMDAPVHAADYRENLGGRFLPNYMGAFRDLVRIPLQEERVWGDIRIVYVGVSAGAWGNHAFRAYVDDIRVGKLPAETYGVASLETLCRDLSFDFAGLPGGTVAIIPFAAADGSEFPLLRRLDEMLAVEIGIRGGIKMIDPRRIAAAMHQHGILPVETIDIGKAVELGRLLGSDYIITGTVVETASSLSIFARILKVQTGQVESTQDLRLPKDQELNALLQ